jgi:4-alpha-glucanotransferase
MFVAPGSVDVQAHPDLFRADALAGAPPDVFNRRGQLWGSALYDWGALRRSGFRWWIERLRRTLELVDVARLDHFRGFVAAWAVPLGHRTATRGSWQRGPGAALFAAAEAELGPLPLIAEDLGRITEPVERLRVALGLPGIRVLQFGFEGTDGNPHRPGNITESSVVFTGTHDNDTTVGWFRSESGKGSTRTEEEIAAERKMILDYLRTDGHEINWDLIDLGSRSNANTFVVPLQDLLGLGSEARMNTPGVAGGNWQWRFSWDQITDVLRDRLTAGRVRRRPASVTRRRRVA